MTFFVISFKKQQTALLAARHARTVRCMLLEKKIRNQKRNLPTLETVTDSVGVWRYCCVIDPADLRRQPPKCMYVTRLIYTRHPILSFLLSFVVFFAGSVARWRRLGIERHHGLVGRTNVFRQGWKFYRKLLQRRAGVPGSKHQQDLPQCGVVSREDQRRHLWPRLRCDPDRRGGCS